MFKKIFKKDDHQTTISLDSGVTKGSRVTGYVKEDGRRKPAVTQPDTVRSDDTAARERWYRRLPGYGHPLFRRPAFWIVAVATLVSLSVVGVMLATQKEVAPVAQQTKKASDTKRLGAVASVVDGTVEISSDNKKWQAIKQGDNLRAGVYLRTANGSRAVVALDDGSAIRVNGKSTVRLASLNVDNVVIANIEGEVYSRVVASERKYSVVVGDEAYQAMGTAYMTVNTDLEKGAEVFQSKVKASEAGREIAEGKRYYHQHESAPLQKKVTDIPLDELHKDAFLKWNLDQDKQSSEFKDKLGYLEKMAKTPKPETTQKTEPKPAPAAAPGVYLTGFKYDGGISLSWKVTGITASKGYKVLKSLEPNPVFGDAEAAYVSDGAVRSHKWKLKDGKTYHFRVCVYTGESCDQYSNDVAVTAPLVESAQPSGSVTLKNETGKNVSWTLNGSSPGGYKLVWSTTSNPTYPANNPAYYGPEATSGSISGTSGTTYYVRICMYSDSGCSNYSNEVTVTIP